MYKPITIPELILPWDSYSTNEYFLGWALSDGCITDGDGPRFKIELKYCDREILYKWCDYLETDRKRVKTATRIKFGKPYKYVYLHIRSKEYCDYLKSYKIVPRKSLKAKVHDSLRNSPDFWRAMLEGDGCLYWKNKYPCVKMTGSYDVCKSFRNYIIGWRTGMPPLSTRKNIISKHDNIYQISYSGQAALNIVRDLYREAPIVLSRKFKIYLEFIKGEKNV